MGFGLRNEALDGFQSLHFSLTRKIDLVVDGADCGLEVEISFFFIKDSVSYRRSLKNSLASTSRIIGVKMAVPKSEIANLFSVQEYIVLLGTSCAGSS